MDVCKSKSMDMLMAAGCKEACLHESKAGREMRDHDHGNAIFPMRQSVDERRHNQTANSDMSFKPMQSVQPT